MKSMWQAEARRDLTERVARLTPDTRPSWGRMNAPQVVAHLTQAMRMATGELRTEPKSSPLRFTPLKQLVIYVLPWPQGTPTAPELLAGVPTTWDADVAGLCALIDTFGSLERDRQWPVHPAFGKLSAKTWGALGWRHVDHHLRQFGV